MTNPISLHADTRMGHVSLTVTDLARSLDFYQNNLGFQVHHQTKGAARLGAGEEDLLELVENPAARIVQRTTGLYHFAILVPSRFALAQSLARIAETRTPVTGFADHYVSEAIYLPDPDGNGIEIYRDRPRASWEFPDGSLKMGTDPLDIDGVLGELAGRESVWEGLHSGTTMGHIHLHVRDIPEADAFYADMIGFDRILSLFGSATFLSAGGYHHHLGANTWNGRGAPTPPADAVGLRWYTILLASEEEYNLVSARLEAAGVKIERRENGAFLRDPSGNGVLLQVQHG